MISLFLLAFLAIRSSALDACIARLLIVIIYMYAEREAVFKMTVKARRVAVIGAGPSGAIATDALVKEQAFDIIRVFDRRPIIGGTW